MPKGEYYVGDLSYVLRPELNWEISGENGKFELSDGRVVGTFNHEGCQDTDRWSDDIDFHVKDGMIGITLLAGLEEQWVPPADWMKGYEWGRLGVHLRGIVAAGKEVTMMDYINHVGTIVVYDTDFDCQTNTTSHYKHDDHMTKTTFGDKINIDTCHGSWDSDDESWISGSHEAAEYDELVDTATDDKPEAEAAGDGV
jgi:hypothetical protein